MTMEQMDLEKYIAELRNREYFLERSDDFCYTNGKMERLQEEIRNAEKMISSKSG